MTWDENLERLEVLQEAHHLSGKKQRKDAIREIIQAQPIERQAELVTALEARGFIVTQATVSRDIKEMRLIKVATPQGRTVYALPKAAKENDFLPGRMLRVFSESILSVENAENLVVVKTTSGSANAVCEVVDGLMWQEVVGTLAGDNTILMVSHSKEEAARIVDQLHQLMMS